MLTKSPNIEFNAYFLCAQTQSLMLPFSKIRVLHIAKLPTNVALFPLLAVLVSLIFHGSRGGPFLEYRWL